MILEKLTINNIGTYCGEQVFDLSPKKKYRSVRPIILIGGKNGAGKTTLLQAIDLCLYGKSAIGSRISQKEYEAVARLWNLGTGSRFEMGDLPMRVVATAQLAEQLKLKPADIEARLKSARQKLQAQHKAASMPVDGKVVTAWNALLLSALSQAAMQLDDKKYQLEARKLRDFLVKYAWDGSTLYRARDKGKAIGRAGLEDYAYLARALSDFAVLSGSKEDLYLADLFTAKAWLNFYQQAGWKTGDENLLPGMTGKAAIRSRAQPMGIRVTVSTGSSDWMGLSAIGPTSPRRSSSHSPILFALARSSIGATAASNGCPMGIGRLTSSKDEAGSFLSSTRP